jgi:hypothetical protein
MDWRYRRRKMGTQFVGKQVGTEFVGKPFEK